MKSHPQNSNTIKMDCKEILSLVGVFKNKTIKNNYSYSKLRDTDKCKFWQQNHEKKEEEGVEVLYLIKGKLSAYYKDKIF
jgi:hypothetical protein